MLSSFIPKLFIKPLDVKQYKLLQQIYDHSFKHGWSVDVNENIFDMYYKIITGYHHISNNYNRNIIH